MRFQFDVTYTDGRNERLVVRPAAIVAFEETTGESAFENMGFTKMTKLAHAGVGDGSTYEAWLSTVDDIEPVEREPVPPT